MRTVIAPSKKALDALIPGLIRQEAATWNDDKKYAVIFRSAGYNYPGDPVDPQYDEWEYLDAATMWADANLQTTFNVPAIKTGFYLVRPVILAPDYSCLPDAEEMQTPIIGVDMSTGKHYYLFKQYARYNPNETLFMTVWMPINTSLADFIARGGFGFDHGPAVYVQH